MRRFMKTDHSAGTAAPERPDLFAHDNMRAIVWILISVVGSSAMTLFVRGVSDHLNPSVIVLYRAAISLAVICIALLFATKWRRNLRYSRPWMHIWRGVAIGISTHLGFYAIANLELVTATVLFFTAPIFATVFSIFVHRELPGIRRWIAIGVGFVGVLIVLRPDLGSVDPAMFAALASSLLFGIALVMSRAVAEADGAFAAFISAIFLTLVVSIPLSADQLALPSTPLIAFLLFMVVVTGSLRSIGDLQAYRLGEASLLAPFVYLRLVIIGFGAYLIFGQIPDRAALMGAAIIVASTIYIGRRERKRASKT
jgi:drug/metabolite transporter (DMT)-like permease